MFFSHLILDLYQFLLTLVHHRHRHNFFSFFCLFCSAVIAGSGGGGGGAVVVVVFIYSHFVWCEFLVCRQKNKMSRWLNESIL